MGEQVDARRARVEAVEHPTEDKQGEKGRHEIDLVFIKAEYLLCAFGHGSGTLCGNPGDYRSGGRKDDRKAEPRKCQHDCYGRRPKYPQ